MNKELINRASSIANRLSMTCPDVRFQVALVYIQGNPAILPSGVSCARLAAIVIQLIRNPD